MTSGLRAHRGEHEHDQAVDERQDDDRVAQRGLGDPAGQDRMRRVQGANVALGVDAAGHVEVVVDQVVGGVGQHQADDRQDGGGQLIGCAAGSPASASTASSTPIVPDQIVIGKTAARVMTSHLPTVSSGSVAGGFAVCMISDQARSRSRRDRRGRCRRRASGWRRCSSGLEVAVETCDTNVSVPVGRSSGRMMSS